MTIQDIVAKLKEAGHEFKCDGNGFASCPLVGRSFLVGIVKDGDEQRIELENYVYGKTARYSYYDLNDEGVATLIGKIKQKLEQ